MSEQITTLPSNQNELIDNSDLEQARPELAKTVKIMERMHASDVFATPEQSKDFLDSLNYDDFKKWIGFVNGIELGIPKTERGQVGNSYIQSESLFGNAVEYRPPNKNYRDRLLQMAFEKAQSIDDPEIAGLTLGLSINAIHYFADGNGRTARMAFSLLSMGYDGSEEAQDYYSSLLENIKGREIVNPNPTISKIDKKIRSEMFESSQEQFGYKKAFGDKSPTDIYGGYSGAFFGEYSTKDLAVSDEITDKERLMLYETMESGGMAIISLAATFGPDRIKDFVQTSPDGSRTFIDGDKFLPTLTQEEIKNWCSNSEKALISYAKRIINIADRDDIAEIAEHYKKAQISDKK